MVIEPSFFVASQPAGASATQLGGLGGVEEILDEPCDPLAQLRRRQRGGLDFFNDPQQS
jgi:hypothetical protein